MAKLKVFRGNYDGIDSRLVATTSKPKAMELLGMPNKRLFERDFSVIENHADCEIALLEPEVVFSRAIIGPIGMSKAWQKVV